MGNFPKAKACAWLRRMVIYYMVWMHGKHEDMEAMAFEPIKKGMVCKHAKHAHKQEHKARAKPIRTKA